MLLDDAFWVVPLKVSEGIPAPGVRYVQPQ